MERIKVTIDGCEVTCCEGESILNVARANSIFIPAICYLSCASPTLACKMCMVEADGKRVYACNAKVKDGMQVVVNTPEIEEERVAIMQAYDVNHPLQCGVCDKSGECELQNYTHYVGVKEQNYALKDSYKPFDKWGKAVYDPNLCIVCERCVTLCKDKIGKSHIKALKFDGEMPDKAYKDSMPKDAYGVWTKFKKSLIGLNGVEADACGDCGECVSVCPVGALSIGHFQYRSNAWELEKIDSTCVHCANGCALTYEVKQKGISGREKEVYRVVSDWNFSTLCPAGRLAFSANNQHIKKDLDSFNKTIAAFKEAQTIKFASDISNEEALMLQQLKERFGYKLVCDSVYPFKKFLDSFSKISGNLGSATQKKITQSTLVITFGGALSYDMPVVTHNINNAMKQNKGANLVSFHTMEDVALNNFVKSPVCGIYKPDSEEAMALLLASVCIPSDVMPEHLRAQIANFEQIEKQTIQKEVKKKIKEEVCDSEGNVTSTEKEITEMQSEEVEVITSALYAYCGDSIRKAIENTKTALSGAKNPILVIGFDVYGARNAENIAKILGYIEALSVVKIMLLPPGTNALGIALICDLDKESLGYSIGYNVEGKYTIGVQADNVLQMPYLSEQEGTLVNVDKRVVPIAPATPYYGYCFNDIAKALGLEHEYSVDYTRELPIFKGFKSISYDDLEFGFANDGTEIRGYLLEVDYPKEEREIAPITLESLGHYNLYVRNSVAHFSKNTLESPHLDSKNGLQLSKEYAQKLELEQGDKVEIDFLNGVVVCSEVSIDRGMQGDFAALGVCEAEKAGTSRYVNASIKALK
ncbi:NADH-quinone oxidoreductase subunit G [Helicobacter turcicus]|uniref:NADH-quinone oxidoreductase subunit G n=1 Tax=Helicobacter turcicus TaxID=2867412 RepID=A0ABS7JL91_9HELI|nr:NADH-quinone oxidoreductase subunit G [Helicobacter turcicus]MBX7490146.1 NADH-quinone oxidoreductase subunit G [Helicobacter turcicus]MBX7545004.1 NADH-quinone oxidoreductase subunit G [Helicobacter turcicus]